MTTIPGAPSGKVFAKRFRYPDYYPFPYCKWSEQLCSIMRYTRQANTQRHNKQKTCQQTSGKENQALESFVVPPRAFGYKFSTPRYAFCTAWFKKNLGVSTPLFQVWCLAAHYYQSRWDLTAWYVICSTKTDISSPLPGLFAYFFQAHRRKRIKI